MVIVGMVEALQAALEFCRGIRQLAKPDALHSGISAPRVSKIQAEAESSKPQGPMRMLLDCYKVKR